MRNPISRITAHLGVSVDQAKNRLKFRSVGELIAKADHQRDARNWQKAAEIYKNALDIDPSRKAIWVQYGHALKEYGRLEAAVSAYRAAIELDKDYEDAKIHLAHLLKNTGSILPSIEIFRDLLQNHHANVSTEIAYLQSLVDLDDETELVVFQSISSFRGLAVADSDTAFVNMGDAYRNQRNWAGAAAAYASALLKNPALAHIWVQYGHALKESGAVDKAVVAYRKATRINGPDMDARLHLAHAYKLNGRFDDALNSFILIRKSGQLDVEAEIGALTNRQAKSQPSRPADLVPQEQPSAPATVSIGDAVAAADSYRDRGLWPEAATAYGVVLQQDPTLRPIWVQRGHALKEAGDLAGAEAAYDKAASLDPGDPDPLLHLAHLLKRMRRFDDALAVFQKVAALPGHKYVEDDIASLLVEAEKDRYLEGEGRDDLTPGTAVATVAVDLSPIRYERIFVYFRDYLVGPADIQNDGSRGQLGARLLNPISLFCRLHDLSSTENLRIVGPDSTAWPATNIGPEPRDLFCVGRAIATVNYTVEEAAFITSTDIRIRFGGEGVSGRPCALRLYQLSAHGTLEIIAEAKLNAEGPHFIDVQMLSRWMPVLAVFTGADLIVDMALLPFPSLLRGGTHFGETLAARLATPSMASPALLPMALLDEFLGISRPQAPFAVGRVLVDLEEANGGEIIFSAQVRAWMAASFGLAVAAKTEDSLLASKRGRFLADALSVDVGAKAAALMERRAAAGSIDLVIPGHALPTLSAMVSRRPCLPQGQHVATGSFIQADVANYRPRQLVNIPMADSDVIALQPADRVAVWPVVCRRGTSASSGEVEGQMESTNGLAPLAISYQNQEIPQGPTLLMPRAPDFPGPVLRRSLPENWRAPGLLSVIICDTGKTASAELADFLSAQTVADWIDIVRVERMSQGADLSKRIVRKFPGRHRIIDARGECLAGAINRGLEASSGRLIAVVNPTMILHDPRCLEVLCTMAMSDRVATAGCVQLHEVQFKRGQEFTPVSGGYFPTRISLSTPPALVFKETRTDGAFPQATYPVAANAFRLAVMRREILLVLRELNAADFPEFRFDLEFSLRALAEGYLNLCTSAVTAATDEAVDDGEIVDILSPATLSWGRWQQVLTSLSMIREL